MTDPERPPSTLPATDPGRASHFLSMPYIILYAFLIRQLLFAIDLDRNQAFYHNESGGFPPDQYQPVGGATAGQSTVGIALRSGLASVGGAHPTRDARPVVRRAGAARGSMLGLPAAQVNVH